MKNTPEGDVEAFALVPSPAPPKKPKFPSLDKLPETPAQLFAALAESVELSLHQPDPTGKRGPQKQDYTLPWRGFTGWRDARKRLEHFEKHAKAAVTWAPFNDTESNDGPMSLNAYPGRAFVERVTNGGDANLEAKAQGHQGPMPASPMDAAALWFGLGSGALAMKLDDA